MFVQEETGPIPQLQKNCFGNVHNFNTVFFDYFVFLVFVEIEFEFVFDFDQSSDNLVTCWYDFAIDVVLMVDFILRLGEAEEGSLGSYGVEFPIFAGFWFMICVLLS